LIVGFLQSMLFLVRRPEDVGLVQDRIVARTIHAAARAAFSPREAMRTTDFWRLSPLHVLRYPVQAGVSSIRRALIERGDLPIVAATVIQLLFRAMSPWRGRLSAFLPRRWPMR